MQRPRPGPQTRNQRRHQHRSWTLACLALVLLAPSSCRSEAQDDSSKEKQMTDSASALLGVEAIDAFIAEQSIDKSKPRWKTHLTRPPKVNFDPNKEYYWHVDTNLGAIVCD